MAEQTDRFESDDPRSLFDDWKYGEAGIGMLNHSLKMTGFDRLISESCHKGTERVNRLEPSEPSVQPYFRDVQKVAQFSKASLGQAAQLVWAFNSLQLRDDDRRSICLKVRTQPSLVHEIFATAKDLEETCVIPEYPVWIGDEPDDRDDYELEADAGDAPALEIEDVAVSSENGNELRAIPIGENDSDWDWVVHHSKHNPSFETWFKGIGVLASRGRADALSKRNRALFDGTVPKDKFQGKELTVLSDWTKMSLRKVEHLSRHKFERLLRWVNGTKSTNARAQLFRLQKSGRVQFTGHKTGQWSQLWGAMNARFPKKEKRPEPPPVC